MMKNTPSMLKNWPDIIKHQHTVSVFNGVQSQTGGNGRVQVFYSYCTITGGQSCFSFLADGSPRYNKGPSIQQFYNQGQAFHFVNDPKQKEEIQKLKEENGFLKEQIKEVIHQSDTKFEVLGNNIKQLQERIQELEQDCNSREQSSEFESAKYFEFFQQEDAGICSDKTSDGKFQTEIKFKSEECFKLYKNQNIEMCADSGELVVSPRKLSQCNNDDGCVSRSPWLITIPKCIEDKTEYLSICINEFGQKGYWRCGENVALEINNNINEVEIDTIIKTIFTSNECLRVFQNNGIEICSINNEKLVSPERLAECDDNNPCIARSSWQITTDVCRLDSDYLQICLEEFEVNEFTPCQAYDNIEQEISGGILKME